MASPPDFEHYSLNFLDRAVPQGRTFVAVSVGVILKKATIINVWGF